MFSGAHWEHYIYIRLRDGCLIYCVSAGQENLFFYVTWKPIIMSIKLSIEIYPEAA
jgi:hypothetical protein